VNPPNRPSSGRIGSSPAAPVLDPFKLLKKYKVLLTIALFCGIVVGVGANYLLLYLAPSYKSKCFWEATSAQKNIGDAPGTDDSDKALDRFMATQVEIMTSDSVIQDAAKNPKLRREAPGWWDRFTSDGTYDSTEAALELKDRVSAKILPRTKIMQLSSSWNDPTEVQVLTRFVRLAYDRALREQVSRVSNDQRDVLQKQISQTDDEIDRKQKERDTLVATNGVQSLDERLNEAAMGMSLAQKQVAELRLQQEAMQTQFDELQDQLTLKDTPAGITYSDMMRAQAKADPNVARLDAQIKALQVQKRTLVHQGFGPEHRDIKMIDRTLEAYGQEYNEILDQALLTVFNTQLDAMRMGMAMSKAQEKEALERIEGFKQEMVSLSQILSRVSDLTDEIRRLMATKSVFAAQLQNLEALSELDSTYRVTLLAEEDKPSEVSFPRLIIMVPAGVLLIMGVVGGSVLLVEVLDQRIKGPSDVSLIPRTRVVGVIPHICEDLSCPSSAETAFRDQPRGVLAEAFRHFRGPLIKRMQQSGYKSLMIVSGMPDSGGTTVVANLAAACAAAEQRVLVIDANFRRPGQHKAMDIPEQPGLADVLAGKASLEETIQHTQTANLDVLAAGSPEQRVYERISGHLMDEVLAKSSHLYDLVLLDVAPAIVSGDAMALANKCDAAVLVCKAMSEKRGQIARLRNNLNDTRAEFVGVVVNAVRSAAGGYFRRNIKATHEYQNSAA